MMNILELPGDLLEKIFLNLLEPNQSLKGFHQGKEFMNLYDSKEILNVTTVCKRFNQVIGSSEKLMDSIVLYFDNKKRRRRNLKSLLRTSRSYRWIHLHDGDIDMLSRFLETGNSGIKHIVFNAFRGIDGRKFLHVLSLMRDNLEFLDIARTKFTQHTLRTIDLPKLKTLRSRSSSFSDVIRLLEPPKNLEVIDYEEHKSDWDRTSIVLFSNMLISCEKLKEMTLIGMKPTRIFSENLLAEHHKFQLESLSLESFLEYSSRKLENFATFMRKQVYLKELKLMDFDLTDESLKVILCMPSLKILKLTNFGWNVEKDVIASSASVETLKLEDAKWEYPDWLHGIGQLFKCCPNVRKLIFAIDLTKDIAEIMQKHLKKLEDLKLFINCEMYPVEIPTLNSLYFNSKDCYPEEYTEEEYSQIKAKLLEFIGINPHIKKLILPRNFEHETEFDISNIPFKNRVKIEYSKHPEIRHVLCSVQLDQLDGFVMNQLLSRPV